MYIQYWGTNRKFIDNLYLCLGDVHYNRINNRFYLIFIRHSCINNIKDNTFSTVQAKINEITCTVL